MGGGGAARERRGATGCVLFPLHFFPPSHFGNFLVPKPIFFIFLFFQTFQSPRTRPAPLRAPPC